MKRIVLSLITLAAVGSLGNTAQAQDCYGGLWPGVIAPGYGLYVREHIPYFSLHPPVYYSYPVPRSYGYSPWAYPPGVRTPEIEFGGSQEMINPHVPQGEKVKPAANRSAQDESKPIPQVVVNPFVRDVVAQEK